MKNRQKARFMRKAEVVSKKLRISFYEIGISGKMS